MTSDLGREVQPNLELRQELYPARRTMAGVRSVGCSRAKATQSRVRWHKEMRLPGF
jgi:hypothetical protein